MTIELKGTLKIIFAEKQINDNLSKKDIVLTIEVGTLYPQDILISAMNKKGELLNSFNEGDSVTVSANLRGNVSKDRYYNQFHLWQIVKNA